MLSIFACHIRKPPKTIEVIRENISQDRMEQLNRFLPDDKLRSMIGDYLVLHALRQNGYTNPSLAYAHTAHGKPYFPSYPSFHFNVSHSGQWVVCAADYHPVGIDIQKERTIKPALIARTLTEKEIDYMNSQPSSAQEKVFFDLWCLKEAYLKFTGKGLTVPLKSIEVDLNNVTFSDPKFHIQLISPPEKGYHIGLCCKEPPQNPVTVEIIT